MPTETGPSAVSETSQLIANPFHTLLVAALAAMNAFRATLNAAQARAGLGPSRPQIYLRTILFELLFLGIVVLGVRLRGASLQTIFGRRWSSPAQAVRDLGLGVFLLVTSTVLVSILGGHEQGSNQDQSIAYLLPKTTIELLLWLVVSMVAGICEEAIYRGYFQVQFTALTSSVPAGIFISAAAFGAVHAYQGLGRAAVIGVSALLYGVFANWRGTVRPGMFAHSLQDAIAPLLMKLIRH
jgi:membrane protease YdiL (CAAX protease family)